MAIHLAGQVRELAGSVGVKLRGYEVAGEHLEMVKAHIGPKGDVSGIYGAVRQESGLPYESK